MRRAFTLIELVLVIAIVAVLVSLVLPAAGRLREQGRLVSCSSHLRSLLLGTLMYVDGEGRGSFPAGRNPYLAFGIRTDLLPKLGTLLAEPLNAIAPYLDVPPAVGNALPASPVFRCPADTVWGPRYGTSYLFWPSLLTSSAEYEFPVPSEVRTETLRYERRDPFYNPMWQDFNPTTHHKIAAAGLSGCNRVGYDGSIGWTAMRAADFEIWLTRTPPP